MPKFRFALLALLLFLGSACRPRTTTPMTASGNDVNATPRVFVGFGTAPTPVPTATLTPTATATEVATAAVVTSTVIVTQTVVVAAPTATAMPEATAATPASAITATAAIPTFVPTPTPPPAPGIHCDNPLATITSPPMNATIHGTVIISGTANTQDFLFYKIQYMPDASHEQSEQGVGFLWGELYQSKERVVNGKLMEWQTRTVAPGVYWLRLLVTRHDGNYDQPCELRVVVVP